MTFSKEETEAVRAAIRGFLKIGDACYRLSDVEYVEVKGNGHFVKMKGESSAAWVSDFNAPGARFVLDCNYR